jgi:hypothetical protein
MEHSVMSRRVILWEEDVIAAPARQVALVRCASGIMTVTATPAAPSGRPPDKVITSRLNPVAASLR